MTRIKTFLRLQLEFVCVVTEVERVCLTNIHHNNDVSTNACFDNLHSQCNHLRIVVEDIHSTCSVLGVPSAGQARAHAEVGSWALSTLAARGHSVSRTNCSSFHYFRVLPSAAQLPCECAMDKTKSKLAAFFDNDDEESSFPVRRTSNFSLARPHSPPIPSVISKRR